MNISVKIEKKDLLTALAAVQGICSRKTVSDITNFILIEIENNELVIKATDLEVIFQTWINVKNLSQTVEKFTFFLHAKRAYDLIKDIDNNITLTFNEKECIIKSDLIKASIVIREYQEEIHIPSNLENIIAIKRDDIFDILDWTGIISNNNAINNALNCLFLEIDPQGISATSTDGHCLAHLNLSEYKNQIEQLQKKCAFLIPKRASFELKKILESVNDSQIVIGTCNAHIVFSGNNFNFFVKNSTEKFPDYKPIVNTSYTSHLQIKKETFSLALKRTIVFLNGKFIPAKFQLENRAILDLSLFNQEIGQINEKIDIIDKSENFTNHTLSLYPPYILQGVSKMKLDKIDIFLSGEKKPVTLQENIENKSFFYVAMPIIQK